LKGDKLVGQVKATMPLLYTKRGGGEMGFIGKDEEKVPGGREKPVIRKNLERNKNLNTTNERKKKRKRK